MAETFNCTFALFATSANISAKALLEECTIIDVTRKGSDIFYDIIKYLEEGM